MLLGARPRDQRMAAALQGIGELGFCGGLGSQIGGSPKHPPALKRERHVAPSSVVEECLCVCVGG